jgi:hypothetical protein
MALFIKQNDSRTELQERVAAELQEKAKSRAAKAQQPDGVTDSNYLKDTKATTSLAWLWIVIVIIAVGILIAFMLGGK